MKMNRYAALAVGLYAAQWASAQGQAPAAGAAPQQQQEVVVTATKLGGNVYGIDGQGGRMAALVGADGVFLVDAQFPRVTDKIVAAIKNVSPAPLRFLVNTHVHGDHTGGNANVGGMGIEIIAHDNVRVRLAKGVNGGAPAPAVALPAITYGDTLSLHLNGEDIQVAKLPPAHTDGDSYIRFPKADVIHVGDVFRTIGYPGVDAGNGGTVKGTIEALQAVVDIAGPNTKIVPGHGVVSTREDVAAFRDLTIELQKRVSDLIRQGMTLEQVVAAKPTADLDAKYGSPERFLPGFYAAVKAELQ